MGVIARVTSNSKALIARDNYPNTLCIRNKLMTATLS